MNIDYLRISITDKCNLRCIYCHPLGGCDFLDHKEILSFEEIHRIARLFVKCGIRKIRLTGGEPLIRRNIVYLVRQLAGIAGIAELAVTTNGVLLGPMAAELKAAGLNRVNISMDSAETESYEHLTGFDLLPRVIEGIYKAIDVGLTPVKINCVVIKSVNLSQILPLAKMSIDLPVTVRFIEYCPTTKYTKPADDYVPTKEVRRIIESEFGTLCDIVSGGANGPASHYKIKDSAGSLGFISGRSSTFCQSCNRLRMTSDGKIRPCLYSSHDYDIKKLIRSDATDKQVLELLKKILREKNNFTKLNSPTQEFSMRNIGG